MYARIALIFVGSRCCMMYWCAYPAGNRISKRNEKDTGQDIKNSCLFEIQNDIIC